MAAGSGVVVAKGHQRRGEHLRGDGNRDDDGRGDETSCSPPSLVSSSSSGDGKAASIMGRKNPCANGQRISRNSPKRERSSSLDLILPESEPSSWFTSLCTYWVYTIALLSGIVRDLCASITGRSKFFVSKDDFNIKKGYARMLKPIDSFYSRRLYFRYQDVWNRPLSGIPGAQIDVLERKLNERGNRLVRTGTSRRCVNLGSYNYLGFADDWMETCRERVVGSLSAYGTSCCSPLSDVGTTAVHEELEAVVADFVGKESALVFNMGYGTNATTIPALVGKGSLIISDTLNHTSIVNGARASGARVKVFSHNDVDELERVLREAIVAGQPYTHRPWKKILVMVEGIYSMEGEICDLPGIVRVCKKYRAYIYVDEAHSIGALGNTGRGVCEHYDIDPAEIDILMGTFTKSFGAMGGYVAASREIIDHLRSQSAGCLYSNAMSPVVCQQILTAFRVLKGEDGTDLGAQKVRVVKANANYFRRELQRMGCDVLGDNDSPVIPMMLFIPSKISLFSRMCFERNVAVVVVGFPAVPLMSSRARFCISAAHTREDLNEALAVIRDVVEKLRLRYRVSSFG